MSICEMSLFKKDTDAIGTNRGFLYQYLKTVNTWVKNYLDGKDIDIYCETEDDIKELDLINSIIKFTQVKCYSTSFSLKSDDIQKSIFNFFILYSEYNCDYSGEFKFVTNSKISRNSILLDKWALNQGEIEEELLIQLIHENREIIKKFIKKEKESQVKSYEEMISNRKNKMSDDKPKNQKIQKAIDEIQEKIDYIENQYKKALEYVEDNEVLKDFIFKIKWEFDDISAEESVEIMQSENIELISRIKEVECAPKTMEARLLTEVFHKSSQSLVEKRVLTNKLLKEIIKESEEEMHKKADAILVSIYYRFDTLEDKIDVVIDTLKERENERIISKKKEIDNLTLQVFDEDEIEKLVDGEEKKNQSNLERKISNIGLEADTEFLIDIATNNRCSYLLYLEELKLTGRTNEYQIIKKLEQKVRRICFTQVRKNQKIANFNPHDFWLEFQDTLTEEAKTYGFSKQIEIDEEIVFAQMYQIAAECPLRWHKE